MLQPVLFGGPNARRLQPSVPPTNNRLACAPLLQQAVLPYRSNRRLNRWLLAHCFGVPDR
jgi:hypothetical protein